MNEDLKMDDLQFRRTIYADPQCNDENVKKAAAEDPAKQEFWGELKRLDKSLQDACKVDVPEGLAERLILRQSIKQHASSKKRTRFHLALAASVAFVFGVSFTLWQQPGQVDLGEHALAHVYHEADGFALKIDGDVEYTAVNDKLSTLGAKLEENIGRIYFAHFCNFDRVRSFHMVFEGDYGKVTVFVIPNKDNHTPVERFSDGKMHGETLEFQNARLVMVGEEGKPFEELKSKLKQGMIFSA